MEEAEWVALVTRIEESLCIVPFTPRQEDVITLLSLAVNGNQHMLRVEDLTKLLAESEAENDQWQKKLADTWAERDTLREVGMQMASELGTLSAERDANLKDYLIAANERDTLRAELEAERTWREELASLSIDQQVEIERLKGLQ